MARRPVRLAPGKPLLDIASYARRGPSGHGSLSPEAIEQIRLTVRRAPEVVVKVLGRGAHDLAVARAHLGYVGRQGALEIETDDGQRLAGEDAANQVISDWNLELDAERPSADLRGRNRDRQPKLFHKVTLSMPPGTPPAKVLAAAREFARDEFALTHRYAMVLHTDEPHPHVHLTIRAQSEQDDRLHIRKATLREWRASFAQQLRKQSVAANATDRAVRGQLRAAMPDGLYRAARRRQSYVWRERVFGIAEQLQAGRAPSQEGRSSLLQTRRQVEEGWRSVAQMLKDGGHRELAEATSRFVAGVPAVRTDQEHIAAQLVSRVTKQPERDRALTR